jgi:hypothetical protein
LETLALHEVGHALGLYYAPGGQEAFNVDRSGQQWSIMTYVASDHGMHWCGFSDLLALKKNGNTQRPNANVVGVTATIASGTAEARSTNAAWGETASSSATADLLVVDVSGRRVGSIYASGVFQEDVNEIPGALYQGHGCNPNCVIIPNDVQLASIAIIPTSTGNYDYSWALWLDGTETGIKNGRGVPMSAGVYYYIFPERNEARGWVKYK